MDNKRKEQESMIDFKINMPILRKFISSVPNGVAFHKAVFDQTQKPVDYVFLEANDAFESLTGLKRADILNRHVTEVLPGIKDDSVNWIGKYGKVAITGVGTIFESYSEHLNKWYRVIATCPEKGYFMTIFSDITGRKSVEKQREELITQLREALAEIRQLRGIIPICASCKKIRDDKGIWTQIESYIRDHSEADFSHSICPECAKKLYPELSNDCQTKPTN